MTESLFVAALLGLLAFAGIQHTPDHAAKVCRVTVMVAGFGC